MHSRLGSFAAGLAEAGWLAALAAVPTVFNVYSDRTFEPDKIFLLRSLAAVILAGTIIWCIEQGRSALAPTGCSVVRLPLVRAVLALTAAYVLSTVCSILPYVSWWGSYLRAQGTLTWLSYVVAFLAIVLLGRESGRADRLVTVLLLGSFAPALYGVLQHFGYDPIYWGYSEEQRVTGSAGNAIFLSGFLIMVVPLTAGVLIDTWRAAPEAKRARYAWSTGVLLAAQVLAILYTKSRGPAVGLAAGVAVFVLLCAVVWRARWPVFALGAVAGIGLIGMTGLALTHGGLTPKGPLGRLGGVLNLQQGSGKVRVYIWQGVADLVAADRLRALVGYGPDTLLYAFNRVYPPALVAEEGTLVAPDRAHNDTLEALATTGIIGCLAELTLFVAFFYHVLCWLGLLSTAARRRHCVTTIVLVGIAGGVSTVLATSDAGFISLGISLGIAAGVLGYVAVLAMVTPQQTLPSVNRRTLLLIGLFAGVLAHFVEIQVGIATSISRLYFFAYAGLAVVLGTPSEPDRPAVAGAQPILLGTTVGLVLIVLTFDLYTPNLDLGKDGLTLATALASVWVLGAALLGAEAARPADRARGWAAGFGEYAAASLAVWLLFVAFYQSLMAWAPPRGTPAATARAFGMHLGTFVSVFYAFVLLCVGIMAAALTWARPTRRGGSLASAWGAAATLPLLGAVLAAIVINLEAARADGFAKLGKMYEARGRLSEALVAHQEAQRRAPGYEEYAVNTARVLIDRAERVAASDPQRGDADAAHAVRVTQEATHINPWDPDLPANLGRIYRKWAQVSDAAHRAQRLELAEHAYEQALTLRPNQVALWNELALLRLERGDLAGCLETFATSLRVYDGYDVTYWLRAHVYFREERFGEALADYDRALALNPKSAAAWIGKALVLARLDRREAAAAAASPARRLVENKRPGYFASKYYAHGFLGRVLTDTKAVLPFVDPEDRPGLERFIRRLETQAGKPAS